MRWSPTAAVAVYILCLADTSFHLPIAGCALDDAEAVAFMMEGGSAAPDLMQLLYGTQVLRGAQSQGEQLHQQQQQQLHQQQQQLLQAPHYLPLSSVKQLLSKYLSEGDVCAGCSSFVFHP
jgi:hypothetical protein